MASDRQKTLHRRSLRLEWFTVAWNVVETFVAIGAGIVAGSVALICFSVDSGCTGRGRTRAKMDAARTGRHFTVAVFVVFRGEVLLHRHRKLGMWLPPGGHIEKDELPDEAAVREVLEETGIEVELVGERREDVEDPVQLCRPAGVQLENIGPGHQHIDLIYFARPLGAAEVRAEFLGDEVGWYGPEDWDRLRVNDEVRGWCERAVRSVRDDP